MTAIAAQTGLRETGPSPLTRTKWAVSDTLTIARRNLIVWYRVPAYIFFSVVQPVIFVLLFRYVFGGAIPVHGNDLRSVSCCPASSGRPPRSRASAPPSRWRRSCRRA